MDKKSPALRHPRKWSTLSNFPIHMDSHGKHYWFGWQRRVWLFLITLRCSCPRLPESSFGVPFSHQRDKEAVLVFVPVLVNEDTAAPERTGYPAVSKPFSSCQAIPTSLTLLSRHHDRRIPLFFLGGRKQNRRLRFRINHPLRPSL